MAQLSQSPPPSPTTVWLLFSPPAAAQLLESTKEDYHPNAHACRLRIIAAVLEGLPKLSPPPAETQAVAGMEVGMCTPHVVGVSVWLV